MEHPVRVEEEREGGTGPRGRDRGGERPPGVAVWVVEGIIRVVKVKTPSAQASLLYQVLIRQMFVYTVFVFRYAVFSCQTPSCVPISS